MLFPSFAAVCTLEQVVFMLRRWQDDSLKNVVLCIALLLRHGCESQKLTVPFVINTEMYICTPIYDLPVLYRCSDLKGVKST